MTKNAETEYKDVQELEAAEHCENQAPMIALSENTINTIVKNAFNAGVACGRAEARCEVYRQEPVYYNSDGIDYADGARGLDDPDCPF